MDNFRFELGKLEGIMTSQGKTAWKAESIGKFAMAQSCVVI